MLECVEMYHFLNYLWSSLNPLIAVLGLVVMVLTLVVTVLIFLYGDGWWSRHLPTASQYKSQIELYFLPFLSEQEFFEDGAASSQNERRQSYYTSSKVEGRTGKASLETLDVSSHELRVSCSIPIYADYVIEETGKKKKEGRNKDLVAHVTFVFQQNIRQLIENKTTLKNVMFLPASYNVDTGRWHNELLSIRDAFEGQILEQMFTKYPMRTDEDTN